MNECGILHLNKSNQPGSHWVAYLKKGPINYYFGSYGVQPHLEIIDYLKSPIYYSTEQIKKTDQIVCAHFCRYVLKNVSDGKQLQDIVNTLY